MCFHLCSIILVSRNCRIARIGEDMCNMYYAHHFLFTYVVGKRNHMTGLRKGDLFGEKWPKFTSFHLILQQYWNWKNVVNAIKRKLTPFNSF